MESVIEVFLDKKKKSITEKKHLNYNRYKTYTYELKDYLERNKHAEVYKYIQIALN